MISAIGFVPQGKADPRPKRYELSTGEMNMLKAVEVSLKPVRPSNHYYDPYHKSHHNQS